MTLEKLTRSQTAPMREVQRAKVLLLAADGVANEQIAAGVGVSPTTVRAWRARFAEEGLAKLGQVRRGGAPSRRSPRSRWTQIVHDTLNSKPRGETHWSCRSMAAAKVGVSRPRCSGSGRARGLKPHLVDTFKLSNDPGFEEKLIDVVGLYLNPPDKAVVLCMDEKSSVQALDRTQPSLPMKPGRAGTMTHDYKRHGTTTLFAALNVLTGQVIGQCLPRHRPRRVPEVPAHHRPRGPQRPCRAHDPGQLRHPQTPRRAGLAGRHPRFHLHFTPTSSSWLNLVERWFRELTDKALRRGVFNSVPDLIAAIEEYLDAHNEDPKPFVWTATAESILEKVRRGRVALQEVVNQ